LAFIWENQTGEREDKEEISSLSACLYERGSRTYFYIDTAIGNLLLKISIMLRKAILFHFIYL
jgi:hypothetical protein